MVEFDASFDPFVEVPGFGEVQEEAGLVVLAEAGGGGEGEG